MNGHVADCLSFEKDAVETTIELAASLAVDGDAATHSCTDSTEAFPWWAVDLGADSQVGKVTITFPAANGENCSYCRSCFVR